MLVLSRKCGQAIVIADDIVVSVVEISRGRVQIGIQAPRRTTIIRQELLSWRDWTNPAGEQSQLELQAAAEPPQ